MATTMQFKVGDQVRVTVAGTTYRARLIEDRGPIGVGGRHLLRVEVVDGHGGTTRFEVTPDQVRPA